MLQKLFKLISRLPTNFTVSILYSIGTVKTDISILIKILSIIRNQVKINNCGDIKK